MTPITTVKRKVILNANESKMMDHVFCPFSQVHISRSACKKPWCTDHEDGMCLYKPLTAAEVFKDKA